MKSFVKVFFLCLFFSSASLWADVQWFPITTVSSVGIGVGDEANIAVNNSNQAVIAWDAVVDGKYAVFVKTWSAEAGFSSATRLSTSDDGFAVIRDVAINDSGQAIVVYLSAESEAATTGVYKYSILQFGGEWSTAAEIPDSTTEEGFYPDLQLNNAGQAIFIWQDDSNNHVHAATLQFGGSWTTTTVTTDGESRALVSLNDNGQALATVSNAAGEILMFTYDFSAATPAWTAQTSPSGASVVGSWSSDINNSGQILFSWFVGSVGQPLRAATSTFAQTLSWSATDTVQTTTGDFAMEVHINEASQMSIVYVESDVNLGVATSTFPGGSWTNTAIGTATGSNIFESFQLHLDDYGKMIVCAHQAIPPAVGGTLFYAYGNIGGSWSTLAPLSDPSKSVDPGVTFFAANNVGLVAATWTNETDGTIEARFGSFSPLPPGGGSGGNGNVSGSQRRNRFALQTEFYNHVTWNGSPSPFVSYTITTGGVQLALTNHTHYDHRGQKKGRPQTYSIRAVNSLGQQSTAESGTVPR